MKFKIGNKKIKLDTVDRKDKISITGLSPNIEWLVLILIFGSGIIAVSISAILSQFYFSEIVISDEDSLVTNQELSVDEDDLKNLMLKIERNKNRLEQLRGINIETSESSEEVLTEQQ